MNNKSKNTKSIELAKQVRELKVVLDRNRTQEAVQLVNRFLTATNHDEETEAKLFETLDQFLQKLVEKKQIRAILGVTQDFEKCAFKTKSMVRQLASALTMIGDFSGSIRLLQKHQLTDQIAEYQGKFADWLILNLPQSSNSCPPEYRDQLQAIIDGFKYYEQNKIELAQEKMQIIGIHSPFMDWKLLLRGLIAYSRREDERAKENWQRLSTNRVPGQITLFIKEIIDKRNKSFTSKRFLNFYAQTALGSIIDLFKLQKYFYRPKGILNAFDVVEKIRKPIREYSLDLWNRLNSLFYWETIKTGIPTSIKRYRMIFRSLPEDPQLNRLCALFYENHDRFDFANQHWEKYIEDLRDQSQNWSDELLKLAEAMILERMANNLDQILQSRSSDESPFSSLDDSEDEDDLQDFDEDSEGIDEDSEDSPISNRRLLSDSTKKDESILHSRIQKTLKRAIEISPKYAEPYKKLIQFHIHLEEDDEAEPIVNQLIENFPNDLQALQIAADLQIRKDNLELADTYMVKALEQNPLDRELCNKYAHLCLNLTRRAVLDKYGTQAAMYLEKAKMNARTSMNDLLAVMELMLNWKLQDQNQVMNQVHTAIAEIEKSDTSLIFSYLLMVETICTKQIQKIKSECLSSCKRKLKSCKSLDEILLLLNNRNSTRRVTLCNRS